MAYMRFCFSEGLGINYEQRVKHHSFHVLFHQIISPINIMFSVTNEGNATLCTKNHILGAR